MNYITILGLIAGSLTTFAFFPQTIKTWKTKHTKDLSLLMYIVLTTGVLFWFIYGILRKDLPVMLANGISLILSASILFMKIMYG